MPWYLGGEDGGIAATPADVRDGVLWLDKLLGLLPEVRLVIAMGQPARRCIEAYRAGDRATEKGIEWLSVMHPGMRNKNSRADRWPEVESAFGRAAEVARLT